MLKVRRMLYWHWRPSVVRIGMGAIFYVPGLMIQLGHYNPPCRVCGDRDEIYAWDEYNPGAAICINCCEHPDYEYDRCERRHFCVECGNDAPYDWSGYEPCEGDVSISFAGSRDPDEPLGTPISELSGRPVGPLHPDRPKYDRFVAIAKSWGYD